MSSAPWQRCHTQVDLGRTDDPLLEAVQHLVSADGVRHGRARDIRPIGAAADPIDAVFNDDTDKAKRAHTDGIARARPPRWVVLGCVRAAAAGGETLLYDGRRVVEDLDDATLSVLTEPRFKINGELRPLVQLDPLVIRFYQPAISLWNGRSPWPDRAAEAAVAKVAVALEPERAHLETLLRPGDVVIIDNHVALHGRRPFRGARWLKSMYLFDEAEGRSP